MWEFKLFKIIIFHSLSLNVVVKFLNHSHNGIMKVIRYYIKSELQTISTKKLVFLRQN